MFKNTIMPFFLFWFWNVLAYLHLFTALCIRLIPQIRKLLGERFEQRFSFEKSNFSDEGCKSFFLTNQKAKICFQIASEGEFEQVRWMAEKLLQSSQLIEIIFTSPSVEHRILTLHAQWDKQVKFLRTPLVTLSTKDLSHWITAPTIIMVRYDFYPMIMSLSQEKKLVLLWFFKPRDRKKTFEHMKWNCILPLFKLIVSSNTNDWWWLRDKIHFKKLFPSALDLRTLSIFERIDHHKIILSKHFGPLVTSLLEFIQAQNRSIIHGNAYESELVYLTDLNWKNAIIEKKVFLAIVAHHPNSIQQKKILSNYQIPCYEITSGISEKSLKKIIDDWHNEPGIFLFSGKGFLLELYSYFKIALVGGGFKQATHSILEPYLAGTTIFCGPKIYRSSEYFQVKDLDGQKLLSLSTIEQWKFESLQKILLMDFSEQTDEIKIKLSALKQSTLEQSKVLLHLLDLHNLGK